LTSSRIPRETGVVSRAVRQVHDGVREGESIATPLRSARVFTPVVVSMIEVGEETGKLHEMLMKIADNFEEDVDHAVAGFTSIIEPVLIVFLAIVVGFLAVSMLLPLFVIISKFTELGPGS
jgi:type IV pilus assembly protein PilC